MFLNHYIFTFYILWHTYHTLNAQFAEFHLCTPVVLNKVMDETVEFGVFTFCERFKVRWPILIYNAMQPTIFPSYLTSFSWHFLESPVWIKSILSHWFRAVDTPNLLWLFHASLIQFDPVWSSLIQFPYHPLNNWIIINVILRSAALILLSKLYLLTKSYIFSQSRSSDFWHHLRFHQPLNLHHEMISFHANLLMWVALLTYYYGSYFTNNLALISSTYTFITFLIMQF